MRVTKIALAAALVLGSIAAANAQGAGGAGVAPVAVREAALVVERAARQACRALVPEP